MKTINRITQQALNLADITARFKYNPFTGDITFKVKPRCKRLMVGDVAGTVNKSGYRKIQVDGVIFAAHRLAWFMHYGSWPVGLLDHVNGNKSDNRITNLRDCGNGENKVHAKLNKNNRSGATGVRLTRFKSGNSKWKVMLGDRFIGYFHTRDEAIAARRAAETRHYPGFEGVW